MRILHFSDVHIGVETFGRPATEADVNALPPSFAPGVDRRTYLSMSTRLLDFLAALDEVVDSAIRERVDLVLFCGDAYKSRDPSQTHQREFARRLARLVEHGIPVFMVAGNHDLPHAPGRASAVEIFPTLRVPLVQIGDRVAVYQVGTGAGPLQVMALPWVRRGVLLAQEDQRGKGAEEVTRAIEEELTRRLQEAAETLDPSLPAVLAGHVTVSGAVTSTERSMMLGRDHVLQLSSVALPAFDYVALGHIHRHQALSASPPVVYPGSLQRVDFSEEGDAKGFCLVELDPLRPRGGRARWEFAPVKARPFVTVQVDIRSGDEDPTRTVIRAIQGKYLEGAVVRLQLRIPAEVEGRLNERAVFQALSAAHTIGPYIKEVVRERRVRLEAAVRGMAPADALRAYLESHPSLDPDLKRRALERGLEMIQREVSPKQA